MPFHIDEKKDRAWLNEALRRAGLKKPSKKAAPEPTLGLLGKRILMLTPEHRLEVERLVSKRLAEQEMNDG